jgi:predicted XRE-type DNA-binding protein
MELMKPKKESEKVERLKQELLSMIEQTMEKEGISQGEMARRLGAQRTNINNAMRGKIPVTLDFLVKMANAIGLDVEMKVRKAKA